MAIYNDDVKKYIYTRIGDDVKREALEKSQKYRKRLSIGGVWALVIGAIFLVIVIVMNDIAAWLYVLASLVTAAGLALIISGVTIYYRAKKKYRFDSYNYGERHYQEVLDKVKKESYIKHQGVEMGIEYVDELTLTEILSSENKGSGPAQKTYFTYKLTYSDGSVKEETIKSTEATLLSLLNCYNPTYEEELKV